MVLDPPELLGLIAGAIGASAMAPQAIKIFRDNSAEDVSAVMYVMVLSAAALWVVYGIWRGAPSIVFWNAVSMALSSSILVLKWRADRAAAAVGE
jgi:MtN3 and saliva related transmembrane protein